MKELNVSNRQSDTIEGAIPWSDQDESQTDSEKWTCVNKRKGGMFKNHAVLYANVHCLY